MTLLAVGFTDPGWNLLLAGRSLSARAVLFGKAACFPLQAMAIIAIGCYVLRAPAIAIASCTLLALFMALLSFYDSLLIAGGRLRADAALRLFFALGTLLVIPAVAVVKHSAVAALVAAVGVSALSSAIGATLTFRGASALKNGQSAPAIVPSWRLGVVLAVQLPNNFVSNGMITLVAALEPPAVAATARIMVLALGLVVACAPIGAVQIAGAVADSSREGTVTVVRQLHLSALFVLVASALVAAVGPLLIQVAFSGRYGSPGTSFRALALCGPLLVLAYAGVPLTIARGSPRRAAVTCFAASVAAAIALGLLLSHMGLGALAVCVTILAASVAIRLLDRRFRRITAGAVLVAIVGMATLL